MSFDFSREKAIEKKLRSNAFIVPTVTLVVAAMLFTGIYFCMRGFEHGYWYTIFPAALLAHAFFIITVHDGAHKAITRTKADHLIMNLGASVMLLPFYGEPFRKFHLVHHANTNADVDPLWSPLRKKLYTHKRWLYITGELIPFVFKLILLLNRKQNSETKLEPVKAPAMRWYYFLLSFSVTGFLIWLWQPSVWFVIFTLLCLNLISLARHWCEHIGTRTDKESNTFWFPLGMGIGNHEAHHEHPHFSWLTMMIGLFYREKDTNPFKTVKGIMLDRNYMHYTKINR